MEKQLEEHSRQIAELYDRNGEQQVALAKLDGISDNVTKTYEKVLELCPVVKDNKDWITRMKGGVVWIAVIAVGGGLASILFIVIKKAIGV